ncbi:SPOR domain-containing protein [Thermus islandicus]|uniref:SPOR domain-containing protein n=1 Tax=Thermus islandicus TaxID=540988 RepID=UPI0003B5A11A|nr:SPOR domain-containing protein [Thermus islandicus]
MRWLRENWLDALIFLLIALVAAGIVLYLTGVNPFARPQAAPLPAPQGSPLPPPAQASPQPAPKEVKPPEPVVTVMPLPRAPEEPPSKPAEASPPKLQQAAPPKEKAPQNPPSGSPGSYRVAVGAFANPENAAQLERELAQKGYPARLEASGSLTRVVVGPYASEAEARRAAEALSAYGAQVYRGQGAPPPKEGSVYLQVGAFQKEANALALAGRLREMGLPVVLVKDGVYRVRVGPVSPEEKEAVRSRIAALGLPALEVP